MGKTRRYDNGGVRKPKFKRRKHKATSIDSYEENSLNCDHKNLAQAEEKFYEDHPWDDIFSEDDYESDRHYK
tara:strand:+ start:177 stop:392 length:216 start_codon:yes stop_codon:yes gene_type:complete